MTRHGRTSLGAGILLVLFGGGLLALNLVPGLKEAINITFTWPWIVIGVGGAMLFLGLLTGAPGMAVPAMIVAGIGGILYYQDQTGDWESWAYLWTLIPGFVGLGVFISELLEGHLREAVRAGARLMLISIVMFLIFASFLGGPNLLGDYWPVLLILLGIYFLASPWVRFKK